MDYRSWAQIVFTQFELFNTHSRELNMPDKLTFPVSEEDVSRLVGRPVLSPIRVSSLTHIGINQDKFLSTFSPFFEELPWDPYDTRRMRVEFLKEIFPIFVGFHSCLCSESNLRRYKSCGCSIYDLLCHAHATQR